MTSVVPPNAIIHQRLKPAHIIGICGMTEVMPCYEARPMCFAASKFFPSLFSSCGRSLLPNRVEIEIQIEDVDPRLAQNAELPLGDVLLHQLPQLILWDSARFRNSWHLE